MCVTRVRNGWYKLGFRTLRQIAMKIDNETRDIDLKP